MGTSGELSIPARPGPFEMIPQRCAVIVVDMQNDFSSPQGMFARAGVPVDGIQAVVEPTRRTGHFTSPAGVGQSIVAPDGSNSRVLIRDTWNTRILDELTPQHGDVVIPKHRYSGFTAFC